ncbi:hypothetical protein [Methanoculleus bourgensis]|jgi:hypothetical protein|uniref:Uncharacterized protein n=1 Tax=Methanoculleus bourgensis TaxID=83986 RepID=A0A0X3BL62_9EURY|nr:hypothetical protein [Methanoculleus bourgensis]CVK32650.1 conserved exported protein of unknown function [Methanoculleus bourgensis]
MKPHAFSKARMMPAACCLVIALMLLAAPAMAATTEITVTKYCDNNYSAAADSETLDLAALQALSSVYSNGPVYMQGGTFDYNLSTWAYTEDSMTYFGGHNGTYVSNITDRVGGMSVGDEIKVAASDGYGMYFNYTNVYAPAACQGDMILAWWDSDSGVVPTWTKGLRLFFYTPAGTYGMSDSLNFTNADMRDSMASWYWRMVTDKYSPYGTFPSAKGLTVQTVSDLEIYPPHRYDFNTTGDTTEWAYEGEVSGVPNDATTPSTQITNTIDLTKIADDDGTSYSTSSNTDSYYAAQRFVFNVTESAANIEKLNVTWIGTGTNAGGTNGADLYIWNGSSYELLQSSTGSTEVMLTGEKTSSISNYINDGNVTVLVKQKSASDGFDASVLVTDYVKLVVTHHHSNS